jgi:hypothetical protein
MSNVVQTWKSEANLAGELELADEQLMAIYGAKNVKHAKHADDSDDMSLSLDSSSLNYEVSKHKTFSFSYDDEETQKFLGDV